MIEETNLVNVNFFFVDIVGLSEPSLSTKTQMKKIRILNKCIRDCKAYGTTPQDKILFLPTGDGMALGFFEGLEKPLQLAVELQRKLNEYNKAKIPSEIIRIRIGLHSGPVFFVQDLRNNNNFWGPGIILARRVMDLGDDWHILLTHRLAEDLIEVSDEYRKTIKLAGRVILKHGKSINVYSAHGKGFGNPRVPSKMESQQKASSSQIFSYYDTFVYPSVSVSLTIKDNKKMLVHHKRVYQVKNISDLQMKYVLHGIATDVKKNSLDDLKIRIYDIKNRDLEISQVRVNEPYQKEFITSFVEPIETNHNSQYTLEYEVEEPKRYFENAFLTDCSRFILELSYPANPAIRPIIYEINQESDKKTKLDIKPIEKRKAEQITLRWIKKNISKGETFRLEW